MRRGLTLALAVFAVFLSGCSQIERPAAEPFYAQTPPPPRQEFRWSNGKAPKTFDPAHAAAAPETDIVRAIYEGLTELDSKTLKEIPGVAEKWESSPDLKTWTFHLRKDARWSNGDPVTADDFVRSWKRLAEMRERAANHFLFHNVVGMREPLPPAAPHTGEPIDFIADPQVEPHAQPAASPGNSNSAIASKESPHVDQTPPKPATPAKTPEPPKFGVAAVDARTLTVTLELPDKDLPKLVANPVFRPIHGDGTDLSETPLSPNIVTNGAFRIASIADNGITLERSDDYWNRRAVTLERVRFVPIDTAEKALAAYRAGTVDAVTNASFEPLAIKLLSPYEDFRRTTHSALNFYEINTKSGPFNDRRVREALAIAIDRDRITEGELEGSTQPAYSFLPLGEPNVSALTLDVEHARENLTNAGFPNGQGFPQIRLVINRNDTQMRVAKSVARMWRQNLNLDTAIIVKEASEIEKTRAAGDYDLIRRGAVMPTTDEMVSLASIVGPVIKVAEPALKEYRKGETTEPKAEKTPAREPGPTTGPNGETVVPEDKLIDVLPRTEPTLSEDDSIFDIYAIPLYFPTSYSLVKPYVRGFEMNGLDAPLLNEVTIDSNWQPKTVEKEP